MGKKSKKNFRSEWRTLTELGAEFGKSAIAFGKILKENGLRNVEGEPTEAASGLFQKIEPNQGKPYYLWNHQGVVSFLQSKGINPVNNASYALKDTEARKLAREYLEAQKLDDEGSKLGYMMLCEMVDDIKKIGLDRFNTALKAVGYKGEPVTLEGW
ncbi:hypothetical protein DSM106972_018740 [Dulcicalothrix desertica PCC 7102]|uniref:Uncharacterized protein n=1 Tax=Dulcicalothrix desertica PCC 7102 TaxID=232991 RepID=A0A3S1ARG1_9CYAN|nr:hypothetical protein [Dulcicalothrix desertica]RUT07614.1 hypothetical protein DSM106972_018740 [Dulcicalothrix desertica PCC 7102]TWH39783.1 hypothetical protein CAL7102_09044 [Dulcicalothrix desertica PCC 7102]